MSSQIEDDRLNFRGFSDDRTEWEVLQMKLFVVASATFLRQELLITTKERAGRQVRKRAEETLKRPASDIRVIQLRRTKTSSQKLPQAGEAKPPVDWQWQWSVRGHVRQQFYRSLNEHLPVYIHEHMKGPEDKPIKPRSTPIFSVTR